MTPEELKELAFAYLGEFGISVNNIPNAILYNRMSTRQREIFTWASILDPDFFGECIVALLDQGGANLNTLEEVEGIYPIESIQIVRLHDLGTSDPANGYVVGDRVRIVRTDDTRDLPPRVTLRSKVLRGVGTDLDGVASLRVWYTRRPRPINRDGTGVVELEEPFDALLAYDLAKYILSRDPETAKEGVLAHFQAEEDKLLANFEGHIKASYRALESRFG